MGDDNVYDLNLSLAIGFYGDHLVSKRENKGENEKCVTYLDLSLSNKGEVIEDMENDNRDGSNSMIINEDGKQTGKNNSSNKDDDENDVSKNGVRKKLKLTRYQSHFLEETFRYHPTLTMTQKQVIATKLNLQPRQIEVWFQNRRARTKLKKIEIDYEYLKKCCDSLSEENKKLNREIKELRSLMFNNKASPMFMQHSKVSKMTSSSEKIMKNMEE